MTLDDNDLNRIIYDIAKGFLVERQPSEVSLFDWAWDIVEQKLLPQLKGLHPSKWELHEPKLSAALAAIGEEPPPPTVVIILVVGATVYLVGKSEGVLTSEELASILDTYGSKWHLKRQTGEELKRYVVEQVPAQIHNYKASKSTISEHVIGTEGNDWVDVVIEHLRKVGDFPSSQPTHLVYLCGNDYRIDEKHVTWLRTNFRRFKVFVNHQERVVHVEGKRAPFVREKSGEITIPYWLLYTLIKLQGQVFSRAELCKTTAQNMAKLTGKRSRHEIDETSEEILVKFSQHLRQLKKTTKKRIDKYLKTESGDCYLVSECPACIFEVYST